jgi:hypothetical protein
MPTTNNTDRIALDGARRDYADALDNLSKYARAECDLIRSGQPIETWTRGLLLTVIGAFDRVVKAGG